MRGASTQAMQTQLLVLPGLGDVVSQTFAYKKLQDRRCLDAGAAPPGGSAGRRRQVAVYSFTGGQYGVASWRCIYRYFRWVFIFCLLLLFLFLFLRSEDEGSVRCRLLFSSGFCFVSSAKRDAPPSSGRSSSRAPGAQTAPASSRTPAGSPQGTGVSAGDQETPGQQTC